MEKLSVTEIQSVLSKTMHPEINYNLLDLGMVKDIIVNEQGVSLTLTLPFLNVPIKDDLIRLIREAVGKLDKDIKIEIRISEMSEEEREKFLDMARKGWKL